MSTMVVLAITPDLNGIQAAFIGQDLREVDANTSMPEWFRDEDKTFRSKLAQEMSDFRSFDLRGLTFNEEGFTLWVCDDFVNSVCDVMRGIASALDDELNVHVPISVSGSGELPRSREAIFRFRKFQNMDVCRRWLREVLLEIKKVKEAELNKLAGQISVLDCELAIPSRK